MPLLSPRIDQTGQPVTRSTSTIAAYRSRYVQIARHAGVNQILIAEMVNWFVMANEQWEPSTIRQYRAAIVQAIEDSALSIEQAEYLIAELAKGPRPIKEGPKRTSARKRKRMREPQFSRLVAELRRQKHPDGPLIARLLDHNVRLFLRLVEFQSAEIKDGFLVVQNAKATNDRSFGPTRHRDLSAYGADRIEDLRELLIDLKRRVAKEPGQPADAFKRLWNRLSSRLGRACAKLRIKQRLSFYSTRHMGMANAKSWMSNVEVAAAAGHKTTATASIHYARRRSGWGAKVEQVAKPSTADVQSVISSSRESRERHMEYLRERTSAGPSM